jgi:hypothetical protein
MSPADKKPTSRSGPRTTAGKKQMLVIMDQDVIKAVKFAALEDEIPMSHAVEEAVKEWLAKRKSRKPTR